MKNLLTLWVIENKNQLNWLIKNLPTLIKNKRKKPKDLTKRMKPFRHSFKER